ncbi:Proteasome subunit beta [Candidatus Lokiarchaeum ossiferum]|uniref:proteasome endopeptidase complex n=1 Tax=Candidatus Lokiarchaeum ossiferum TaxID=2951803 RepID=A0ABY6HRM8_9ARCH|nr:Proteasome subunit beta [Candidatus Lokiarchaeum sp. B-35]
MAQIWIPGAFGVAIRCKDGVVLGNDTRSTYGYTVNNKNVAKIFPLTKDGRVAMTCYGLIGDFQALARIMQAQANIYEMREGFKISVQAMGKMVANYLYQRKMAPLYVMIVIAGVEENGDGHVYTLDAGGSLTEDDYGMAGDSMYFASGMLEAEYKPTLTVKKGVELMKKLLKNGMTRDAMVGSGMDVMTITKDGTSSERFSLDELGE